MKVKFSDINSEHYTEQILYYDEINDLWCTTEEFAYFYSDFSQEIKDVMNTYDITKETALKILKQNLSYDDFIELLREDWDFQNAENEYFQSTSTDSELDYFLSEIEY